MERLPFVLRFGQETAQKPLSDAERETLLQTLAAAGAESFSIWQIEDFWFCYGEYSELRGAEAAAQRWFGKPARRCIHALLRSAPADKEGR